MLRLTRQDLERLEIERLAADATLACASRGRKHPEAQDHYRTCFQCDRDRILHSKSFRRLAHKTQVFLAPEGDHYRTRLIHTLEVAQVARSIARPLGLNEDLTEAIALGHDLGHTPFGHVGERALTSAIKTYLQHERPDIKPKPFVHAEQSARIVEKLERGGVGLNLSFEVVDGILNHPGSLRAQTLEGQVVGIADRIAYVTHDIDDAKRAGLLCEADLPKAATDILGHSSSERIEHMVEDLVKTSSSAGDILMSDDMLRAMLEVRSFLFKHLYTKGDAKSQEPKAYNLIVHLFNYFMNHFDEVPQEYTIHDGDKPWIQVADYVSGMTDRYALKTFERLTLPNAWANR